MAVNDMSDAERAQKLREWIVRFLPSTLIGLALGLGGYYSWSYFDEANTRYNIEASVAFTEFVEGDWVEDMDAEIEDGDIEDVIAKGEELVSRFPEHFYADLSRFILARLQVQRKEYDAAIAHLSRIERVNNDGYSTALAQYRLAQVYLLKSDDAKALEYLDKIKLARLKPVADDLRGDIHLRSYDYDQAWKSWTSAYESTEIDALQRYLSVKIDFIESIPPNIAEEIVREGLAELAKARAEAEAEALAEAEAEAEAEGESGESEGEDTEAGGAGEEAAAGEASKDEGDGSE